MASSTATAAMAPDDDPTGLSGSGDFVAAGVLATSAVVWLLLASGLIRNAGVAADILQASASGAATVFLVLAARRPQPPLGRFTRVFAAGTGAWFLTDLAWMSTGPLAMVNPTPLDLGYATGTVLWAVAAWSTAMERPHPTTGSETASTTAGRDLSLLRAGVDGVVIAASVGVWWALMVWTPMTDSTNTAITLVLTLADAAFVAGALLLWVRATPGARAAFGTIAAASVLLLLTDYLFARHFDEFVAGTALDFGWWSVAALFIVASRLRQRPAPGTAARGADTGRDAARWAQPLVPPAVALGVIADICIRCGQDMQMMVTEPRRVGGIGLLVVLLLVRHVVVLAEHFSLSSRLSAAVDRLRLRVDHDELTGVLSRDGLRARAAALLTHPTGSDSHPTPLVLLWIDIDGFRRINDLLGHAAGDQILRSMANRLRDATAVGDFVARYDGDQFVVLRPDPAGDVATWADTVRDAVTAPYEVSGTRVHLTASIGLIDTDGRYVDEARLLSDAELAMDRAKQQGRSEVERFTLGRVEESPERQRLAVDLRTALEQHQFAVHYQPILDLITGRAIGAEALIRFEHPTRGSISPAEFLPVATTMGMMPELAVLVLNEACATFADDPSLGWVAVNLDEAELADPRLVDNIERVLRRTGLEASRLTIEINERVVPRPDVVRAIDRLAELGVGLALDDFGSSWSSLGQVQKLPLRMVKIDRSVIAGLESTDHVQQVALLSTMVALADAMGVVALAEGIETSSEFAECLAAGVRYGQGFLWAPALPTSALVRYVDRTQMASESLATGDVVPGTPPSERR